MTGLAFLAVAHGLDGASQLLLGGVFGLGPCNNSTEFFFHIRGWAFNTGGAKGAQVVGGLQPGMPGAAIHVTGDLHIRLAGEEVDRLGLVDPLLAARSGVDDEVEGNREDRAVLLADRNWYVLNIAEFALEVFNLFQHVGVPFADLLEIADQLGVEDSELAAEIFLGVEILVIWLDARRCSHDIRNRGRGCDGNDVGIAHALLFDFIPNGRPIHATTTGDVDFNATLTLEEILDLLASLRAGGNPQPSAPAGR